MNKITQILTAILFAAIAMPVAAQTTVDGISYKTSGTGSNRTASVQTLNSHKSNGNSGSSGPTQLTYDENGVPTGHNGTNSYVGAITIPETVAVSNNNYTVTSLAKGSDGSSTGSQYGAGTFQYSGVTVVSLPSTITDVGNAAFADCPFLQNIFVDDENTKYADFGGVLYEIDSNRTATTLVSVPGAKSDVNIESTVTKIGYSAFDGCSNVKNITIPAGVTEIDVYAFAGCNIKTMVCLATTPPKINTQRTWGGTASAFTDCVGIETIYVPDNSVSAYEAADYWTNYNIVGLGTLNQSTSFVIVAELTQTYTAEGKVQYINEITVSGKDGEVFASLPTEWTFEYQDGTYYDLSPENAKLSDDGKAITVTFPENSIFAEGQYTLRIPAASLKDSKGKVNDAYVRNWVIEELPVKEIEVTANVALNMLDSDEKAGWSYVNSKGTKVYNYGSAIIGNYLYGETEKNENVNPIVITNYKYYIGNAEYVRDFKNANWQAYYVPFSTKYSKAMAGSLQFAKIESVNEFYNADKNVTWFYVTATIVETDGEVLEANYPYLVRSVQNAGEVVKRSLTLGMGDKIEFVDGIYTDIVANEGKGNTYRFKGQYEAGNLPKNDYTFAMSKGSLCQPASDAVRLGAYRWYLEINPSDENTTSTFSFGRFGNGENEGTTGLENVKVEIVNDNVYYDLSGRRVENPTKGIYIQNGKKVYVK